MAAHLAFHLGEFGEALRQCQKALEKAGNGSSDQIEDLLAIAAISMLKLDHTGQSIAGMLGFYYS